MCLTFTYTCTPYSFRVMRKGEEETKKEGKKMKEKKKMNKIKTKVHITFSQT